MSAVIVVLELFALVAGTFAWGVVVGRGWRVFDNVEARLLNRVPSLSRSESSDEHTPDVSR